LVVEFETETESWVGNFEPGLHGIDLVSPHPNGQDVVVVASGDLWVVKPGGRTAHLCPPPAITAALDVYDPDGWVFSRQGLALARFGPEGLIWHTRRLSWDGFDQLEVADERVTGFAWCLDAWLPFHVELSSGRSEGGCFINEEPLWESLAG
jgi:hypothetical protein